MRLTIVSGGQTGADRGAMDAAIRLGLDYGGWAPAGLRAEDGIIPAIYATKMRESSSSDYGMRTRLNVQDSDATLIVSYEAELTGGSAGTAKTARSQRKPCKHLVLPQGKGRVPEEVRSALLSWLAAHHVATLNVAGPRESKEPGVQVAVRDTLVWLLEDVAVEQLADLSETLAMLTSAIDSDQPRALLTTTTYRQPPAPGTVADFLDDLEIAARPPSREDVDRLVDRFYALPGNLAGGSLHVVLDDGNWERESVVFCRGYAIEHGDVAGERFADLLLTLTDDQLRAWLGSTYCGRCCQDVEPDLDGNGCRCPEGPLASSADPQRVRVNLICEQPGYNGVGKLEPDKEGPLT